MTRAHIVISTVIGILLSATSARTQKLNVEQIIKQKVQPILPKNGEGGGVAVALRKDNGNLADLRIAFTGTNPRPVLLAGANELCGGPLDERVTKGLDALVRDQIMPMKTTFTPGHYRRRVAGVLARRLLTRLFES